VTEYWSWILGVVGAFGFVMAGKRKWWAWWVNFSLQGLWIAYAIVFDQLGFLVSSAIYTVVFGKNALEWTRTRMLMGKPSTGWKQENGDLAGGWWIVVRDDQDRVIMVEVFADTTDPTGGKHVRLQEGYSNEDVHFEERPFGLDTGS
jgi:hypothetical protein